MTMVNGAMFDTIPMGQQSMHIYTTPKPPEEIEAQNYFLPARDRIARLDIIQVVADRNSLSPAIARFLVKEVTHDTVTLWNIDGWKRDKIAEPEEAEKNDEQKFNELVQACRSLDPMNKEQWTRNGKPMPYVLEKALGRKVTADERDRAWSVISAQAYDRQRSAAA